MRSYSASGSRTAAITSEPYCVETMAIIGFVTDSKDVARSLYRETMVDALNDGVMSDEERQRLDRIASNFDLAAELAQQIYADEAIKAVQLCFDQALSDQRFSSDEEKRLNEMCSALGISLKFAEKTTALVERFKLLARIEAGELPSLPVPILLQRGERCHFTAPLVAHKELRTVTRRINYSGPTASIRIMKGVRWRVGSISPQRITEDVLTEIDRGPMYITSKKLLVQGIKKKTSVQLNKIIHFTVYIDGLQIQKESGKDIYLLGEGDWQVAGACLDSAARQNR